MRELVLAVRPGLALTEVEGVDEVVLRGGGEVFRLPLTEGAVARQRALVTALPALFALLPVAVPRPRFVGVLADGETPFTAEKRLPGVPWEPTGLGLSQLEGVREALDAVTDGQAREWGGRFRPTVLLGEPTRGVLTGLVDWR